MSTKETRRRQSAGYSKSVLLGAFVGLILAASFAGGFFLRDFVNVPTVRAFNTANPDAPGYPLLDEVQGFLDQIYIGEQPAYSERQYAAIRGLLQQLQDANTRFIEPPTAQSEADVLAGTYGGIGVQVRRSEMGEFVLYPFPDGPAAEAGFEDGDILRQINGEAVPLTRQQDRVDQQMRGEVTDGNGVELTVEKANDGETFDAFVAFAVINVPSVVWRPMADAENIGYVQVVRFTNRTPDELREALQDLQAENVEALILDLRNNSGGLLQESVAVAGEFLDGGVVIYERTKDAERTYEAESGGLATELPLVVLVNRGTASASELVAGAIRDRDRGILIGQQTFGKGTVQQILSLSDGSSIHITSAEWFTPQRIPLDGVGLEPNIPMIPDENGRDVEIGEAARYLQRVLAEES